METCCSHLGTSDFCWVCKLGAWVELGARSLSFHLGKWGPSLHRSLLDRGISGEVGIGWSMFGCFLHRLNCLCLHLGLLPCLPPPSSPPSPPPAQGRAFWRTWEVSGAGVSLLALSRNHLQRSASHPESPWRGHIVDLVVKIGVVGKGCGYSGARRFGHNGLDLEDSETFCPRSN